MSNLQRYAYPGWGDWAKKNLSYVQAVRVGDRIICSGQGEKNLDPVPSPVSSPARITPAASSCQDVPFHAWRPASHLGFYTIGETLADLWAGGWNGKVSDVSLDTFIPENVFDEIDQAFENCDYNLKHAGGKGWSQVYRIVTYSTDIPTQSERIVYNIRKWMPDYPPVWTQLAVSGLGSDKMRFEIDVEAYDPEGAAAVSQAKVSH